MKVKNETTRYGENAGELNSSHADFLPEDGEKRNAVIEIG
jgi:hypothetical protein